ncbi:hypothetical protein CLOM_g4781 [Closterium sp. NIES-68]|nr:hypothetical protein CLOM_g4781 [Closterium sp. NIES-68]GJP72890.1 hypothetical protein CLOP_g3651 [Closterium sp. NIES-67]GJP81240.1 hypothetical protein CLOP_g11403 [Closterium sp. NIES-67]
MQEAPRLPAYRRVFASAFLPPEEQRARGVEWQTRLRHVHVVGVVVDVDHLPFKFVRFALDDASMTAAAAARPAPSRPAPSPAPPPAPPPASSARVSVPPSAATPPALPTGALPSAPSSAAPALSLPPPTSSPHPPPDLPLPPAPSPAPSPVSPICATRPVRAVPCVLWLNSRDPTERHVALLQAATCVHVGALVGVRGRVTVFKGRRQVTVDAIYPISDPNEEMLHWLDCLDAARS